LTIYRTFKLEYDALVDYISYIQARWRHSDWLSYIQANWRRSDWLYIVHSS